MWQRTLLATVAILCSFAAIAAQSASTPKPSPTPTVQEAEQDVVRITTNLVQIDVLVTDKDGNQVTDLTANDFELLQDGKPQKLRNVSYISTAPANRLPLRLLVRTVIRSSSRRPCACVREISVACSRS